MYSSNKGFLKMTILYFDCFSGISGDMTIAALLDLGVDFQKLQTELQKLSLDNEYKLISKKETKNHIKATKFDVVTDGHHHERSYKSIRTLLETSKLEKKVKELSLKIFDHIAEAESTVHGIKKDDVHFHEIGAVDSIIDIVGASFCVCELNPDRIIASPLPLTRGSIETEHGVWPLPAPATLELLKNIPTYYHSSDKELVTPTGAAILSTIAHEFISQPQMLIKHIGYGAGSFDTKLPNVLRVIQGEREVAKNTQSVDVIETNIDDMNPQFYELLFERLFNDHALDVFLENIIMKKGRPAHKLTVLSQPQDSQKLIQTILANSTTIGVRIRHEERFCLDREINEIETKYGKVRFKVAKDKEKIYKAAPEYEDIKRIAEEHNISLPELYSQISPKT